MRCKKVSDQEKRQTQDKDIYEWFCNKCNKVASVGWNKDILK